MTNTLAKAVAAHRWYLANREKTIERAEVWAAVNPERRLEIARNWHRKSYAQDATPHIETSVRYYERNKVMVSTKRSNYNHNNRELLFDLLGGKCCRCGFDDVRALQVDHKNGVPENTEHPYRAGQAVVRAIILGYLVIVCKLQLDKKV